MNLSTFYDTLLSCHATLPYRYGNGAAFAPLRVQLEVTGTCNLKCVFCCQEEGYKHGKNELEFSEIAAIIDQVPRFSLLTFSGGEPLLRKDIYKIVNYALERKHYCNISTNGVLLNDPIIELMVKKAFLVVSVSLDGIGRVHDELRGVPGTFEKVRDNLILFSKYKRKENKRLPLLDIKTVITENNIDNLTDIYSFCKEIGADFFTLSLLKRSQVQFNPAVLKEDLEDGCFYRRGAGGAPIEKDRLLKALKLLKDLKGKTKIRFYPRFKSMKGLRNFLIQGGYESAYQSQPCIEPWSSFQINAFGQAYPCLSYYVGDIKKQTLKEIWGSERFVSFRRRLKKLNLFPACDGCCYLKIQS